MTKRKAKPKRKARKTAAPKPKIGRPIAFKPEFVAMAAKLVEHGLTDFEMAEVFSVSRTTFSKWKVDYPDFAETLKAGKAIADDRVERSLYARATGYSHDAVKIFCSDGKVTKADYVEHVPPDTVACIFWLKNRRPDQWRDKAEFDISHANYSISDIPLAADEWKAKFVTKH